MARAHHDHVALRQQVLPLRAGERGNVAERDVDAPALERREDVAVVELERREPHARRVALQHADERRQENRLADVGEMQPERPVRARGIVGLGLAQRHVERGQRLLDRLGESLGLRGRRHAALRADEKRIAVDAAQPLQRVAHGRLRYAQALGSAAHVARDVHRVEGLQEVEVEWTCMHYIYSTSKDYVMDK